MAPPPMAEPAMRWIDGGTTMVVLGGARAR